MKITGTKRILVLLFSLFCVVAASVGLGLFSHTNASAQSDVTEHTEIPEEIAQYISEDYFDEEILHAVADETGIDYDLINFYAHSNNANAGLLYADLQDDRDGVTENIVRFVSDYSSGTLTCNDANIENEDWYVAPDDVSSYAYGGNVHIPSIWTNFYTSKTFITEEPQYWGNSNFAMGPFYRWFTPSSNFPEGGRGYCYDYERWMYNWVWLEEGQSYEFGFYSVCNYRNIKLGTLNANTFFQDYLWDSTGKQTYWFNNTTQMVVNAADPERGKKSLSDYKQEYYTTIEPSTAYMSRTDGTGNNGNSWKKVKLSADAPTGVYYIQIEYPYNNTTYRIGSYTGFSELTDNPPWSNTINAAQSMWYNFSYYMRYATVICRKSITAPTVEYEEGVSNDLMSRTTTYNGEYQTITLNNDWGPGLISVSVDSTDITVQSRPVAGTGTHGNLVLKAKNVGKYTIKLTPYRNWENTDSTAAIEYTFEIKRRTMETTYVVQEEGVNQADRSKFLYETGKELYISLYPVPRDWIVYSAPGLTEYRWSDNGVLTLMGKAQNEYNITVSLKDAPNMEWDDGKSEPLDFKFTIGPMKVTVPDIIKDFGVDGAKLKKEVTYNGALQTMSFMPVDTTYLNVDCGDLAYSIKDNVLIATAQDAGVYKIVISAKPSFIWETEVETPMEYTLIINEAEIDAPRLIDKDAVDGVKTVTYGGEKLENGEDWVATLTFEDCNEARMSWRSNSLSQQGWGDTRLVLAGRSAGTYTVTFTPKKNYKWKEGVDENQQYTLIIDPLRITVPTLTNTGVQTHPDGKAETGVKYTSDRKEVDFDGLEHYHTIALFFGTSNAASSVTYEKSGSVDIAYNGQMIRQWSEDGNTFTLTHNSAGEFPIVITPSKNYCWDDAVGSQTAKTFIFHIKAIGTPSLGYYAYFAAADEWRPVDNYDYHESTTERSFYVEEDFTGNPYKVRIGGLTPEGTINYAYSYVNPEYHFFDIVNQYDDIITSTLEAKDWWSRTDNDGYLTLSFVDAGIYRIRVSLVNTNFCWDKSLKATIIYTIKINASGIEDASISKNNCAVAQDNEGQSGKFEFHAGDNFTMYAIYFNTEFTLAISLPYNVRDYVTITAPDGKVYGKNTANGYFSEWDRDTNLIFFHGTEKGDYIWTITIIDTNYKWKNTDETSYEFKLHIARSGISGVEMHFLGEDPTTSVTPMVGSTLKTKVDITGGGADGFTGATFSEYYQFIYILRSNTKDMVNTGFDKQLSYKIETAPLETGYDDDIFMYDPVSDVNELSLFDENGLLLYALNAGTYTITITPTENYTWKDCDGDDDNVASVVFTFVINKLTITKPVIIGDDEDGDDAVIDNKASTKTITYNRAQQPFTLGLIGDEQDVKYTPFAYKIASFEYIGGENADTAEKYLGYVNANVAYDDIKCEKIYYDEVSETVGYSHNAGGVNLAAQLSYWERTFESYTVWAQSSGEYRIIIRIDNINNYQWPENMGSEECTYYLTINQLGVDLPEAYLLNVDVDVDGEDFEATSDFLKLNGTALNAASFYQASFEYDSLYHLIYIVGSSIESGDFSFSWSASNAKNVGKAEQVQPDLDSGRNYYTLSAANVNTYTISIEFITRDYYWKDAQSQGSINREFKLVVSTKLIEVPVIEGYELQMLRNDSHYAYFNYLQRPESITISGIPFGTDSGTGSTASDTNNRYSLVNAKISSKDNSGTTAFDVLYEDGKIQMFTSKNEADAAQVVSTYCLEFYIDKDNTRWNTSGSGDVANKYFFIVIEKAAVPIPYIEETKTTTGAYLYRTYTGESWDEELKIEGINIDYMSYTLSHSTMFADINADVAQQLLVSAPAPVDTYTVTVSLRYPENMEWKDTNGNMNPLEFHLVINPIKVAKPYIYVGTTEGEEGVVGWKKTVEYNYFEQFIQIGNFWFDDDNRWMTLSVENGEFITKKYEEDKDKIGSVSGEMVYNEYNNGLLTFGAKNAGTYVVRFTLTKNAVWADGTTNYIDVIFVIEKLQYKTPYIETGDTAATISGTTKTFTYELDNGGKPIVRSMKILAYEEKIMDFFGVTGGTESTVEGDGYIRVTNPTDDSYDGTYYLFEAFNADTYVVTFKIKDFENTRWDYADNETISFTFKINRLTLDNPVVNKDYKLTYETVEDSGLTVDYDAREHTILLENIVGNFPDEPTGGVYGSYFINYADTTKTDNPDNPYSLKINRYATTETDGGYLAVKDIFGETYNGSKKDDAVKLKDIVTFTARIPGVYYFTVSLADDKNMVWDSGSNQPVVFTITINRMEHDAPKVETGTSSSQEYAGGDVFFKIRNIYNGVFEQGGEVESSQYEKYEIISYDGLADIDLDEINENSLFEESWFNGLLTLKMSAIGTYTVKVSIIDPTYTGWKNTTSTSTTFTFTITKRNIVGEFSFSSQDEETNANLQTGSTEWAISAPVVATLKITGLREVGGIVDDVLGLKLYFVKTTDPDDELEVIELPVDGEAWVVTKQDDGTYTLIYYYDDIPHGRGNILKGSYMLYAVQTDTDGNYAMAEVRQRFTIVADPAPFKTNFLTWNYTWDTDEDEGVYNSGAAGKESDSGSRLHLPFLTDGGIYNFTVALTEEGMLGFDKAGYTDFTIALNSWQVTWDGVYGGSQRISNAGDYEVFVTITAYDPDFYAFDDYKCTLYITIDKALYDLSGLQWDYDGTQAFEFDGTNKSVNIVGDFPDGLTVSSYRTTYSFTSGTTTVNNQVLNGNTIAYAGEYTTTVVFKTVPNSNYETPVNGNNKTYTGTFVWTRDWTINKQLIEVSWASNKFTNSDGDTITYTLPQISGEHANKFNYTYKKQDANGNWISVSKIIREVGQEIDCQVLANLKSVPNANSAAVDYARNYDFVFPYEENPLIYTLGADDTVVFNHIEINGSTEEEFEYTGKPFTAEAIIDLDTSGGEINANDNIIIVYYAAANTGKPISAPTNPGKYVVKLKLKYSNTMFDYTLSEPEFEFTINKASFKDEEFEWHIKHENSEGSYEAYYSTKQGGKWINIETGEQVNLVYDGYAYNISLVSTYDNLTIKTLDASIIDAGDYTSTARFTYDTNFYLEPTVKNTHDWTIERALLDLSLIQWDYEAPFEYTVVNGNAKKFSVEMLNMPDFLTDKLTYVTTFGTSFVGGGASEAGNYTTTCSINDISANTNYVLGEWPEDIPNSISWTIARKQIALPESDGSWTEFDGNTHNLLSVFGIDVDWNEYFDIVVKYTPAGGGVTTAYSGKNEYGNEYLAYNAGTYTLELSIKTAFNAYNSNIVWAVNNGVNTVYTADNQTSVLEVEKTTMHVTGWYKNYESSYVLLAGGIQASKFIDYEYYVGDKGSAGAKVSLDTILESMGGDLYSMVPVVKEAYKGNITLTFEDGNEFTYFTTVQIDESDFVQVSGKPYIYGYTVDGNFIRFTNDELTSGVIYATYTGSPITFAIYNWDGYYKNYVEIWGGDDLTQTEAGSYSVTLILRKDGDAPYCWGRKEDGSGMDRSSITLNFQIKYKMLTLPELPSKVTYSGAKINILTFVQNKSYTSLIAEYGDYVSITGSIESDIGSYKLYLAIKDRYGSAIRWDDGTAVGLIGTYTFVWDIEPVLLVKPVKADEAKIVYDGTEHTVFESLIGYDADGSSEALLKLMENVKVSAEGFRSVNAGTFTAVFSLPNSNYAWVDEDGKIDTSTTTISITWTLEKFVIDLSDADWNYNEYFAEYGHGFEYTLVNGEAYEHKVYLVNIPEILEYYVSYVTDGEAGNSASEIGTYTTKVSLNTANLDTKNYVIGTLAAEKHELEWDIVKRTFALPENTGEWSTYDGNVHDLMGALGYEDGWENYFDVQVEFRQTDKDEYQPYGGDEDEKVGFSLYNGYYYGYYRLTISIKEDINTADTIFVTWFDGENYTLEPQVAELVINKLVVEIVGWNEDDQYSEVILDENLNLTDTVKDLLEYVIYDPVSPDKHLSPEDVASGITYNIEFRVKPGNEYGIEIVVADGVTNPYEFGNFNFDNQPVVWLPIPVLETSALEFTNEELTFKIKGWDEYYRLSDMQKMAYRTYYNITIPDSVKKFVYLNDETSLTRTAAGKYTAVVRLLNQINLSWYDSSKYTINSDNHLVEIASGKEISEEEQAQYYNRKSYTLTFEVTKKPVDAFDVNDFEDFAEQFANLVLEYKVNVEQDIVTSEKYKDLFAALYEKYGELIDFEGRTGEFAGEYELLITLADKNSSFWNTGETEQKTYSAIAVEGYELRYVQVNEDGRSYWKLVFVAVNDDGSLFVDSSGNYVEYNRGNYTIDAEYQPVYEVEYVAVKGSDGSSLLNEDGTPKQEYLYDKNGDFLYIDGEVVYVEYAVDADGKALLYTLEDGKYTPYTPAENDGDAEDEDEDETVLYVARYVQDEKGYKVAKTEYVYEYAPMFDGLAEDENGDKLALQNADGSYVSVYLSIEDGKYVLRKYTFEADGSFAKDENGEYISTVIEADCEVITADGQAVRYSFEGGKYTEDANGLYICKYAVDENGERKAQFVAAVDENGNPVINAAKSKVTVTVIKESYEPYKLAWSISNALIHSPYIDSELTLEYNGKEQFLKDILIGYSDSLMEITEGASGVNAGEYTAKIKLLSTSSEWSDVSGEYVTITWNIEKATVDLSEAVWDYENPFTYERVNNKAVIRRVSLEVPEVLKDKIRYITNGTVGSNAGRNAGKYVTSFEFVDLGDNFNEIVIPSTLQTSCTWYIQRKLLPIPAVSDNDNLWVVFDNEPHDVLKMLAVPDDWNEYYDIIIEYSNGDGVFTEYKGYDDGNGLNKYLAYGAGVYSFSFNIKTGINTVASNPNVVWFKGYLDTDEGEDGGETDNDGSADDETLVTPENQRLMFIILPYCNTALPPALTEEVRYEQDLEDLFVAPDEYLEFDEEDDETEDDETEGGDNGEDGDEDDDIIIADPIDPDTPDDYDWTTIRQEITVEIGKYVIVVTGWRELDASSTVIVDYNPYNYNEDLVEKIKNLGVIKHSIWDTKGNKDLTLDDIVAGNTYFIHAEIIEKYADYIELVYADDVPKSYDFSDYGNETLQKVPQITQTTFEAVYTGKEIDFKEQYLNAILKDRDYLTIVETESDSLVQTKAGTYYVTVCFTDKAKYCWDSSRPNDRSAVRIKIEIASKRLDKVTSLGSLPYTGSEIDVSELLEKLEDFGEYVTVANGYTSTGKDVGEYTINIKIKDEYAGSIIWSDGTDGAITVSWEITKATISGKWNERGRIDFDTEGNSYTGGYDDIIQYVYTNAVTGEVATTLVKGETYLVEATLLDPNLELGDIIDPETGVNTNPYTFTLTIDIVTLVKPVLTQTELEYTGYERTFGLLVDGKDISEYFEYLEIVEGSDSLSQTNHKEGGYTVTIRLKNGASWEGYGTDDVVLKFNITKAVLSGTWNTGTGTLTLTNTYPGNIISYKYQDKDGNEVTRAQMVKGNTYTATVILLDENNFAWAEDQKLSIDFELAEDMIVLKAPVLKGGLQYPYTGKSITIEIENWDYYSKYVDIIGGGLFWSAESATAGDHDIILKIKDGVAAAWEGSSSDTITITFTITKVEIGGEWGTDGKIKPDENFTGNLDDILDYIYTDADGNEVKFEDLEEGKDYTVTVKVKDEYADSYILPDKFKEEHSFTYVKPVEKGNSFPWWIFLIIGIVVLIIIIIIIIIIVKRRKSDEDEYDDDYYNDEDYYSGDDGDGDYSDDY